MKPLEIKKTLKASQTLASIKCILVEMFLLHFQRFTRYNYDLKHPLCIHGEKHQQESVKLLVKRKIEFLRLNMSFLIFN